MVVVVEAATGNGEPKRVPPVLFEYLQVVPASGLLALAALAFPLPVGVAPEWVATHLRLNRHSDNKVLTIITSLTERWRLV